MRGSRVGSGDLSAAARARHQGARRCLSEMGQERGRRCACVDVGCECAFLALLVQKYVVYECKRINTDAAAAVRGHRAEESCACVEDVGCSCACTAHTKVSQSFAIDAAT